MVNLEWHHKNEMKNSLETLLMDEGNNLSLLETFKSPINPICPRKPSHSVHELLPSPDNYDENGDNILIRGDNLPAMSSLLRKYRGKIQCIYIDPPFATGNEFDSKIFIGEDKKTVTNVAYNDKWKGKIDNYLNFMYKRLFLLKELLSETGSIYVHLDYHASHYLKILMDGIFGEDNFRNEIIWAYPAASAKTRNFFIRSFDAILFYTKSEDYLFNDDPEIYMEYSNRVKDNLKKDEKGYFYYRGGSHDGKKLSRKVYVKKKGIFPRDVWKDIPYIRANTAEYQGFSTQKPERLLKRIILASSNEGDIVGDFFCGTGTTLAVAEKLNRKWIGCDLYPYSIHKAKKRLLSICKSHDMMNWKQKYRKIATPFHLLNVTPPEVLLKNKNLIPDIPPKIDIRVHHNESENHIKVEIKNYGYPDGGDIPTNITKKIKAFGEWIDFWGIDFHYDEEVFNHRWISYRIPKRRELELITEPFKYENEDKLRIGIKIIDVLGKESIKILEV
ncbi:MAG: DNA adenine methyltransferase YhdJ [Promethearchaeota archaeon]|nr:MAG: DNA adenine methyltransferase YhdJ [Candidatus Lokiarchaeota archaeon]